MDYVKPSRWALKPDASTLAAPGNEQWSNKDMDPVPPEKRTWTVMNYVAYWMSDAWNLAAWESASSMLVIGLSWRQALTATVVGYIIIAAAMVLNGTIGARLHINFPVIARSSFGFWFSYFSVISRVVLSMFWLSIQSYIGSQCIYQMLKAIWPSIARMPNHLPGSAQITSSGMLCYFIFFLVMLSLAFVSPQRLRWLFLAKSIVVPPAWLTLLIWSLVKVPFGTGLITQQASKDGSGLSYAWFSAMNSAIGNYATLAVNIPDFTRYAKNERVQYIQLAVIPPTFTLVCFIGIAVTSAGTTLYGDVLWDPLTLIDRWDNRPAAFFVAASFALATLGTNVSANSLSAANDLTALCPKYINIKRGQVLVVVVSSWALVPWKIANSAQGFLSFMGGYTVFLGPFAGIMVADYWIVHRCKVDVAAMYDPYGRYRYTYGANWRAVVTLLLVVPPNIPGLITSVNTAVNVDGASKVFKFAWLFGFFASVGVYSFLSLAFPAKDTFVDQASSLEDSEKQSSDDGSIGESKA
ncbi:NCS1 nucleoside transporter family [Earliella scabrosa]|nr:NCS1 nucleoside transporter family [Earliella scabrosa]